MICKQWGRVGDLPPLLWASGQMAWWLDKVLTQTDDGQPRWRNGVRAGMVIYGNSQYAPDASEREVD